MSVGLGDGIKEGCGDGTGVVGKFVGTGVGITEGIGVGTGDGNKLG